MLRCGQNKVSFFPGGSTPRCRMPWGLQTARPPPPTDIRIPGGVNVKRIRYGILGHPGLAPVAPSRRKMAMHPMPAAGTVLSMPQVAGPARRGYPECGRGTAGRDPDGLFRAGRGTQRGERRTNGCRNGYYLNRATRDRFLPAGEEGIYPTREVIRPALNTAGPDWPPIFTRNRDS